MKDRISLRTRLVLLVVVAITPLFGLSLLRAMQGAEAEVARAKDTLTLAATLAAAGQERTANAAQQLLTALAYLPAIQDNSGFSCERYFSTLKERFADYANFGVVGLDGYTRCHGLGQGNRVFMGDRSYFREAIAQRRFVVGELAQGRLSGVPVVTFAQPVIGADGRVTGVVFVGLNLTELARSVAGLALPAGAALEIQDRGGRLLAAKPDVPAQRGQAVRSPVLQQALAGWRTGVAQGPDSAGHERLWAFMPSSAQPQAALFVSVSMDRDQVVGPSQTQLWIELTALTLVAFLGGWLAWMMVGRAIVAPTRQILHAVSELEKGRFDVRIPVRRHDAKGEFSRIAASFNLMAHSLEQRELDLEKELARNRQAYATLELTINSMQEGLMAVDLAGRMLLVNDTASRLFAIDDVSMVLAPQWPQRQGLFVPGTPTLYTFDALPLYRALQGESGGPMAIFLRNPREPDGRLIHCTYRPMHGAQGIVGALMVFSDGTQLQELQLEQLRGYEQLREVQRKLLGAQRLGRIGNWELDLATNRLWWSDEVYELFGLAPEEFDGNPATVAAMMHPEDRADYIRLRDQAIDNGVSLDVEYRIGLPGGATRWIHQVGEIHVDPEGRPVMRAGVVQDITSRKNAEQAAAHTTELLRRTGDMGKIGGWEVMLDSRQVVWSEQIYLIHEVEPGAPVSIAEMLAFYAPEARPVVDAAAQAAAKHGTPWDLELPMVTARGRRIWVKTQGRAVRRDGKVVRVVGALQDITDKHASEEQLRLLEMAISRLNDIVLITEADPLDEPGPRIVFVNNAFEHCTGYSREEALGRSPRFLQGPATQRAELDRIQVALQKKQPVRAELLNYRKTGEELWLELDMVPLANAGGQVTHIVAIERDITRRKRAQQATRDNEQRYAALFRSAPVPMWIADAQTGCFLAVNEAAVRNYGYSQEEFLGKSLYDLRSGAEQERFRAHLANPASGLPGRWMHRRKDGVEFPVETVARAITYGGQGARFAVAIDISDQVRAEQDVQDYLLTLQRAADATQAITRHHTVEAVLQETVDQARAVVGAHQAVVRLTTGHQPRRVINAVSHSDKYAHCREFVRLVHASGLPSAVCASNSPMRLTQEELRAHPLGPDLGAPGETAPPMRGWLSVPLTGRTGENIGLLQLSDKYNGEFTLRDQYVTAELAQLASIAIENAQLFEQVHSLNQGLEEKVARRTAALARQEALFRALAEQAPQVVWNADAQGKLTYLNRKWYELMGGTPGDWMGNCWLSAIHPDDLAALSANWQASRRSLQPYAGLRRLKARDGSYHTMAYRGTPVLDEQGAVLFWVGIDADVTEIKAIEAALRLSNQELEAFSYSVSHDLRSPLNTIDGFSRLLAKQLGGGVPNDKAQHYLSRIQAGVLQMGRLIEDLLSLAQVSRMQLRLESVDLSAIARDIAADCQGRNPDHAASFLIEDGLQAQGDGRLIRVLLENLVGNAWKFTSRRSQAEIRVGHSINAAGVTVFFVQDNGAGFDMAYADKLFNTFQRLHAATEFPGTGVGLATVSRVIGRHGGQVWAQAEVDKGATFFFTLPGTAVPAELALRRVQGTG